ALAHHCDRRGAVELARDEMFGLAETEEAACRRILQDHGAILPADHEIAPELRQLLCHDSRHGFLTKRSAAPEPTTAGSVVPPRYRIPEYAPNGSARTPGPPGASGRAGYPARPLP